MRREHVDIFDLSILTCSNGADHLRGRHSPRRSAGEDETPLSLRTWRLREDGKTVGTEDGVGQATSDHPKI